MDKISRLNQKRNSGSLFNSNDTNQLRKYLEKGIIYLGFHLDIKFVENGIPPRGCKLCVFDKKCDNKGFSCVSTISNLRNENLIPVTQTEIFQIRKQDEN